MTSGISVAIIAAVSHLAAPGDLTVDQQLIVACYSVDLERVVECLRKGANVNAKFGERAFDIDAFRDRWIGACAHLGADSWTPLNALASSDAYPAPLAELGEVWRDRKRADALRKQIPPDQLGRRRSEMMTIFYILLSHRCNLEIDDGYGATPLYNAADAGRVQMVKALLGLGANPNTKTQVYIDGPGDTTPMHVGTASREIIQLLLDHGADASAKDTRGQTPADWLKLDGKREFDLIETADRWRIQQRKSVTPVDDERAPNKR